MALAFSGAAAVAAAPAVMLPGAGAACAGQGGGYDFSLVINGTVRVNEFHDSGTCNGNGTYSGRVGDARTDGACASAEYRDGSFQGVQGIDCTDNNSPNGYSFNDQTGNTSAQMRLCATQCGAWIDTWGY